MIRVIKYSAQIIVLWSLFWLGNQVELFFRIPIPGNIIGMVILFLLLQCKIIRLEYIQEAAAFLLKHMVFFFIPIAVGLMNWGSFFYHNGILLATAIIISAIVPFWIIALLTQWLHGGKKKCNS